MSCSGQSRVDRAQPEEGWSQAGARQGAPGSASAPPWARCAPPGLRFLRYCQQERTQPNGGVVF